MASGTRLGSMYWEAGLDNSGLQRGLDQSEAAVQRFGNQAAGSFGALAVAAGTLLAAGIQKLASGLMDLGKNAVASTAQMQAMQVGMEGLLARDIMRASQAQSEIEKLSGSIRTLGQAMPQAQEKAKAMMDELAKIAILSPYQIENVQNTFKLAMAYGYAADEATMFTEAILNVAAGTGATNETLDRMAYNFAQIRMQGKVTAVDIRQLAMAGFDLNGVLRSVGEQFGVTIRTHDDFNAAIADGSITWQQFTEGFARYADENFGGASERMSRTLMGLQSTFHDLFALTLPRIAGPALEEVTKFLSGLLDSAMALIDSGVLERIGERFGEMAANALEGVTALVSNADEMARAFTAMIDVMNQLSLDTALTEIGQLEAALDPVRWTEIFGWFAQRWAYIRADFTMLGVEIENIAARFRLLGEILGGEANTEEKVIAWKQAWADLNTQWTESHAVWKGLVTDILETDFASTIEQQQKINDLNAEATDGWHVQAEGVRAYQASLAELPTSLEVAAGAITGLSDVFAAAWESVNASDVQYADENQAKIMDHLAKLRDQYVSHAVNIAQLEAQKNQALLQLEAEYQDIHSQLSERGDVNGLALLQQVNAEKAKNIVAYYNARIQIEQTGQSVIYESAKRAMLLTKSLLMTQLTAQVRLLAEQAKAMAAAAASGWLGAAKAAKYYFEILKTRGDIAASEAAIQALNQAFADIEAQAVSSANAAIDQFGAWQGASDSLAGSLGDLGVQLGNLGTSAGSGSGGGAGPRPMADPIETAAQMAERLAQMVERAIAAFNTLAEFGGPAAGWQNAFRALTDALVELVQGFALAVAEIEDAGLLEEGTRNNVLDFAEMVNKVMAAFSAAANTVQAVSGAEIQDLGSRIAFLAHEMTTIAKAMMTISDLVDIEKLKEAGAAAVQIVEIMKPWAGAIDAINAIANYKHVRVGERVNSLVAVMGGLVKKLSRFVTSIPAGMLQASADAAKILIDALSPWKTMVATFDALAGFVIRSGIGPKADAVAIVIERLIRKVTWLANSVGEDTLTNSAEVGTLITAALKPWKDMVAAYALFADFVQTSGIGPKADALAQVTDRLIRKITWLANAIGEDTLQNSARIAGLIVDALSPWAKMIEVVTAMGTVQEIGEIGPKATMLTGAVELLAGALAAMVDRLGIETLEKAQRVGRMLSDVLAPWEKAIKLADEMRAWQIMPDLEDRMIRFARQWVTIVESLAIAVQELDGEGLALVADFGVTLEALVMGLSEALALALALPATWAEPVSWQPFMTWVQDAFVAFYNWINGWDDGGTRPPIPTFDGQGLDMLGRFGEVLGSLMSGLQAALELALALPETWTQPPSWDDFVTWVQGVFLTFYNWINGWDDGGARPPIPFFDGEGLDLLGRFGDVLGALMAGLRAALELALLLPAQWAEPPSWDAFAAWVQEAFLLFVTWVNENFPTPEDPEAPDQFGAITGFGEALGALMAGLRAALELALLLPAQWAEPPSWDAFAAWVQSVFLQFNGWVNVNFPTPTDPNAPDQFGAITGFGEALGALMAGLSAALDLALALPETWVAPSEETWSAFFDFVTDVFDAFVTYVLENYPTDPTSAAQFEPIVAFGGAMEAVFNGLVSALELFVNLANWAGPSSTFNTRLENFLTAVSGAISDIAAFIADDPNLNPENLASVAVFGQALSELVGGLSDALDLFAQLADTDPSVYTESTLFEDRVGNLLLAIGGTMAAFSTWIAGPQGQAAWLEDAEDFYTAISSVFQVLHDALNLFIDLEENGMPPTPEIQAFVTAITDLFDTVAVQLGGLAQPGGALALAVAAVEDVIDGFPAIMNTYQDEWWDAAGALAGQLPAALVARIGSGGTANTINWALQEIQDRLMSLPGWWTTNVGAPAWYDAGVDFAQALIDGMMSMATAVFDAGEALALAGLDGFNSGAGLGALMEGMMMDGGEGGGWQMDTTHRWEISLVGVGSPTGYDLSFAAVDQITDMLRNKLARGG